jgi:uncharacterized protein YdaU (DUF1376 family)
MAQLPIMPLKTDALLGDTQHMTAEEFGAYCRLLFTMWRHGGRLVDDASECARIAGVSGAKWNKIAARVMRPMTVAGGQISQKRLTATFLEVQELRKKRAEAAETRWSQRKVEAKLMHVHMQSMSKSNAIQNQRRKTRGDSEVQPALPLSAEPKLATEKGKQVSPSEMTLAEINKRWRGATK